MDFACPHDNVVRLCWRCAPPTQPKQQQQQQSPQQQSPASSIALAEEVAQLRAMQLQQGAQLTSILKLLAEQQPSPPPIIRATLQANSTTQ